MTIKELMDAINAKRAEAKGMLEKDDIEGAQKAKDELDVLNEKLAVLQGIEAEEEAKMRDAVPTITPEAKADPVHEFAQAARMGFRNDRTVSTNNEGTGADGGYTVPQDIQTRINRYKEAEFRLETLVDVENVTTMSGRRTFQSKAQHTGFSKVNEGASIGAKSGPQFSVLSYTIDKYAGYLPVTNELLADSDANITAVLTEWLAKEEVATHNAQILSVIETAKSASKVDITGIDVIKTAVNTTLGQAYAGGVSIVTNDDGLNWLDTLKKTTIEEIAGTTDENKFVSNEYLLKPNTDQTSPIKMTLAVGARNLPVVVVPNAIMHTTVNTTAGTTYIVPMIIGDLKEGVKLFDRQRLSIATSTQAVVGTGENVVNAFEMDMTLFRGITRFDVVMKDEDAIVYGEVSIPG